MPVHDDLGIRMKKYYEEIPKTKLMRRCPVIIRIDGKAFHSFARRFHKPFDDFLIQAMQETTKYLCENIQGCVLGYTQSDEISLVLVDYKKLNTSAWFDYEVQKLCSISASMATMFFNKIFERIIAAQTGLDDDVLEIYYKAIEKGAMFDSRCFNIPKEEVTNYIYWRQMDSSRNSVQTLGQAYFSHKQLHEKSCSEIQNMLLNQKGIKWDDLPTYKKLGTCVAKNRISGVNGWIIDYDIPHFVGENRKYIDNLVIV